MLATLASSRVLSMSATQLGYTLSALSSRALTPPALASSRRHNLHSNIRTYAAASSSDGASKVIDLPSVLHKVRQAIRGNNPLEHAKCRNAMAFGMGKHMGCDVSWTFIWRPDGAFYEEIRSRHLTYKWGFDGGADSPCWEVDPTGVSKVLQRDDRESTLLTAFIKSGCWLLPEVADQWLDIELEDGTIKQKQLVSQYMPLAIMPPVATLVQHSGVVAAAAQPDLADSSQQQQQGYDLIEQLLGQRLLQQAEQQQQQQQQEEGAGTVAPAPEAMYLAVKLKGGKLLLRVSINSVTGQPIGYSHPLCSDVERWKFGDWINWATVTKSHPDTTTSSSSSSDGSTDSPDVYYPRLIVHKLHQDCQHWYQTHGAVSRGTDIQRAYQMPASPKVPIDAQYLQRYSERVPIWQTAGGHILAECHINGKKAGWMVLDTGASGLVIEPSVAEQFGLPMFGDLRIAAVSGKVGTRFRRVSQFRIGPLLLSDPVMMEMKVSNLVSNFHDRVVGIAGFDMFRRCRITLPCHRTRMGLIKALGASGKVQPYVGNIPTAADAEQNLNASDMQQRWWEFNNYQMVQQDAADAVHAAEGGHSAAPRRSVGTTAAAAITSTAVNQHQHRQQRPLSRRRKKGSSSSSTALQAASGTAAAPVIELEVSPLQPGPDVQQQQQQRQQHGQQQDAGILARVPVLPRKYFFWQNALIEMLLQRPDAQVLQEGYVWQEMIMIASLPHVEVEFVVPTTGMRHKSLFLLDTGAGGAEMMFHSRAATELGLLTEGQKQPCRLVTGISAGGVGSLFAQPGTLPEVVIRGQYGATANVTGSLVLTDVQVLSNRIGGLDISLYSAGMICIDLLNRTQTVIDYTNKRIGWRVPPKEHLDEVAG